MGIGFISEFKGDDRIFRYVDEQEGGQTLEVGGADPLESAYCQRVVDGRLPGVIHNAQQLPEARDLPATSELNIGAHLSVPIKMPNGDVYGTFCCFSSEPDHSLTPRDLDSLKVFADIAAVVINKDVNAARLEDKQRERVQAVLDSDGLTLKWQPISNIKTGRIVGVEALSRFTVEPIRTPDVWFNEAKSVGLSNVLEWRAVEFALERLNYFPDEIYLACNLSVEALLSDEMLKLLSRNPLHRIVLELTEHDLVNDYPLVSKTLAPLRQMGLRVAVDDAGAGYSTFRHILRLRPDIIKLDMNLTRDIDTDPARAALAEALVRFAKSTGCILIAEGVETRSELDTLRSLGVDSAQGYYLHRPMQAREIKRLLHLAAAKQLRL